jgi:hypothetical protein
MNLTKNSPRFAASGALMLTLGLCAPRAEACGGLFCSASTPVNQAAERIIFAHDDAGGRVTAVIEILYDGPADAFAWILPVPGTPEVGVSTNALLNRLQQATNPNYQLQRTWSGSNCDNSFPSATGGSAGSGNFGGAGGATSQGSVNVLASGVAGPYDYEVIDVADDVEGDPAAEAITWLQANGYDPGSTGPDLLRPYLEDGLNLLAIKLTKQATVGSIRPIKISYESALPMIPIRPTAVAANENMGVLVWVLGRSRAVPFNYKALELNEALLDWFNPQQSYNDVVIAAANETTDGQGFVTELARSTNDVAAGRIADQIFFEADSIQDFRFVADGLSNAELVVQTVSRFSTFNGNFALSGPFGAASPSGQVSLDGVADALSQNLVLPAGVSIADVLASPGCYVDESQTGDDFYCNGMPAPAEQIDLTNFDRTAFLTDVEQLVFAPMEQTVQLFVDHAYMTRFYTTLSAGEMSVDPLFALNPDLEGVSNVHTLSIDYEGCQGNTSGEWEAQLAGRVVRGEGNVWPLSLAERDDMPVNLRILQLSTSGPGSVYEDNANLIEGLLQTQFGQASGTPGSGPDPIVIQSSNGCSLGSTSAPSRHGGAAWLLLGLALWSVRGRREAASIKAR